MNVRTQSNYEILKTLKPFQIEEHYLNIQEEVQKSKIFDYGNNIEFYCTPLPMKRREVNELSSACAKILDLIKQIPNTYFSNNQDYLNTLGYSDKEQELFKPSLEPGHCWFSRADLMKSEQGFKLIEFNIDSSVGGQEVGELNRIYTEEYDGVLNGTQIHDPIEGAIGHFERFFSSMGWGKEEKTIGIIDWYPDMELYIEDHKILAERLKHAGFKALICHQENLTVKEEGLFLEDDKIDILYKFFLLSDALSNLQGVKPIADLIREGKVIAINDIHTDAFSNKGNLALLWEMLDKGHLSEEKESVVKHFIPWTSFVKNKILYKGKETNIYSFTEEKDNLVLKPVRGYGGNGVILGWSCSVEEWKESINNALQSKEPYIIQERVMTVSESMPHFYNGHVQFLDSELNYGVFLIDGTFNGVILRGTPKDSSNLLINVNQGASIGGIVLE